MRSPAVWGRVAVAGEARSGGLGVPAAARQRQHRLEARHAGLRAEELTLRGGVELLDLWAQAEELRARRKKRREMLAECRMPGGRVECTMQTL
jgi:hypothetical protein